MPGIKRCDTCGVPLFVSRELAWGDNGVIYLKRSPSNRMVLYEARVIDSLFKGLEELIGVSVEHIVIESRRREVRKYIEGVFPAWMRKTLIPLNEKLGDKPLLRRPVRRVRDTLGKVITRKVFDVGRIYGYGDARLGPLWEAGDLHPWRLTVIRKPYSTLFFASDCLASVEAFEGRDFGIECRETDEFTFEMHAHPGVHSIELKERMQTRRYDFKPGGIEYERCSRCGMPRQVARLEWMVEEGVIEDRESDRRMVFFGPHAVDNVLRDLEAELGDAIPGAVVEAQRRYVKSRIGHENWRRSGTAFNHLTALRGLGNITSFDADEDNLHVSVQNSCMPLLVVGMAQAIYELALGLESTSCEWRMAEDGDLTFSVRALSSASLP